MLFCCSDHLYSYVYSPVCVLSFIAIFLVESKMAISSLNLVAKQHHKKGQPYKYLSKAKCKICKPNMAYTLHKCRSTDLLYQVFEVDSFFSIFLEIFVYICPGKICPFHHFLIRISQKKNKKRETVYCVVCIASLG